MITIQTTDNGWITIDATDEDVRRADPRWGVMAWALRLAETAGDTHGLTTMGWHSKRGLSNHGFRVSYVDKAKQEAYIAGLEQA